MDSIRDRAPDRRPRASILLTLLVLLAGLLEFAPAAAAQGQHANAALYARVDGDDVKVAVQIRVDPGWHIYHGPTAADMGPPDAVGTPTAITLIGEGFTFGAPRFPTPTREEQDFGSTKTFIFEHVGSPVIWFRGTKTKDADVTKLQAKISGQTCDAGGCIPYGETVTCAGAGSDKLFAKFPADLAAPAPAAAPVAAPAADPSAHARAQLFVRSDGDDVKVAVAVTVDPGWHVYHGPTAADLGIDGPVGTPTRIELLGAGYDWSEVRYPEPIREKQDFIGPTTVIFEHVGTPVFFVRGRKHGDAAIGALQARLTGDTCDEHGCIPWRTTVAVAGPGDDALFANFPADLIVGTATVAQAADPKASDPNSPGPKGAASGGAASSGTASTTSEDLAEVPLWQFLSLAVGWAVFSLLMPCTYPMIPITISYFTKQAANRKTSTLPLSLVYGAGILLSYVAIGLIVGPIITKFAANPWTNLVIGLVFVAFALSLLGLFILQPPAFLLGAATSATRQGGFFGVFLMGMTLCVTSFTCTAPFVGNLLAVGASRGEHFRVILGMGTFGLVMAIPFVFLSMVPAKAKALPKSGEWIHSLKVTLGFIELAAAVKFLSNCDLVWNWNVLSRELVLMLWCGILLVAAFYVWGVITLKEDVELRAEGSTAGIGAKRMVIGLTFFLFAMYFLLGVLGGKLDKTTETLLPTYSKPFLAADGGGGGRSLLAHGGGGGNSDAVAVLFDQYEVALAKAKAEHKQLAINFTGFT